MDEWLMERFLLAKERTWQIGSETDVPEPFRDFFLRASAFLSLAMRRPEKGADVGSWKAYQAALYQDLTPYEESYLSPSCAVRRLGSRGRELSFLFYELLGMSVYAARGQIWQQTLLLELFLEVYGAFCDSKLPGERTLSGILSSYVQDYCPEMALEQVGDLLLPERSFAGKLLSKEDLTDPRTLYLYGEYLGEEELVTFQAMAALPEERVHQMAEALCDGFFRGCRLSGLDLSGKDRLGFSYRIGFERLAKETVRLFEQKGLRCILPGRPLHAGDRLRGEGPGIAGSPFSRQALFDHSEDCALFMDGDYAGKKARAMQEAYGAFRAEGKGYAGPVRMEAFGRAPALPVFDPSALRLSKGQARIRSELLRSLSEIRERFLPERESSFSIIAWPDAGIGKPYGEILEQMIRVNTMDNDLFLTGQQALIDLLDAGERVEILGKGDNRTRMSVRLHPLKNPDRESGFENCCADQNIPAGEVFTSPRLAGTEGILHLHRACLKGRLFKELTLSFQDGRVIRGKCENFSSEEENASYLEEFLFEHHKGLPIGEFAIGTNTFAFAAGKRFGIGERFPVLIAEKTGPHFALGDTCYARCEEEPVYNPDGKEVIARSNELSDLRFRDPKKAYLGLHTDITLPYDELESIIVVTGEGERLPLFEKGRFVPAAMAPFNEALMDL